MNTIWRFTLNIKKEVLISDENQFIDDLTLLNSIWYEYPHYYSDNTISGYRASIIEVDEVDTDYIENIYNIKPNVIYWYKTKKHLIFYFKKSLNKFDYDRTSKALEFLYDWKAREYHFYPINWVTTDFITDKIDTDLTEKCTKLYFFKSQLDDYQKILDIEEYDRYLETHSIPIKEVIEKVYDRDIITIENLKQWIDERHNIHRDYWYPFELVNKFYWSIEKTKRFFFEKFEIPFKDINSFDHTKVMDWVVIRDWEHLFLNNFWYFTLSKEWAIQKITDFYIKVHSKIIWNDWKHHFIVSLVNESEWVETSKIIWENKTSAWLFSDFIQSYWPYHYYWTSPFIKELHRKISTTKQIPEIKQIIWYWHHKEHDIIIFKNWVWDIKERLFTVKKDSDDDFYYNYDWAWFWVTDKQKNTLSTILTSWVPSLNLDKVVDFEDIINFMDKLYADNSGSYLIFLAFWMMWYLLYWDQTKQFPLIFTRWITWSWKSAFNEILQKVWGIEKSWTDFENSTLFTMTVTLSYLIKFPYFIAEYREAASQRLQKVWTLRSVFDKISQTKGRADQSVVKYDYVAVPVLDWEEMIVDWALRTRSIQYQLLKKHKIDWNFNKILRDWWDILSNILFTYLSKSNWENYQEYLDEWYEIFKPMTSQNRIAQNIANIYAWCMCFDSKEDNKEMYKTVLSEVLQFQEEDVKQNSTSMQILKVMSKFMENSYNWIFVRTNDIVISWNTLEDYVNRYRIDTTLKINSYREHLITMWFDIEYVDVWLSFIEWVIIPFKIIPKNLLVHHETYTWYKKWIEWNKT